MNYAYDFHIHSCLSPCADDEMTPYNLVNMARVLELPVIALTDHNSAGNCRSAIEAGQAAGVIVVPGMELCTAEEIHVICLFPDCGAAERFGGMVYETLPPITNKPEVFGSQLLMDARDGLLGTENRLLATASSLSVDDLPALCREHGGCCYPAHIDRPSHSILAVFGVIEAYMGFHTAELMPVSDEAALKARFPALGNMRLLRSSDAHALEMMVTEPHEIELPALTAQAVVETLRRGI